MGSLLSPPRNTLMPFSAPPSRECVTKHLPPMNRFKYKTCCHTTRTIGTSCSILCLSAIILTSWRIRGFLGQPQAPTRHRNAIESSLDHQLVAPTRALGLAVLYECNVAASTTHTPFTNPDMHPDQIPGMRLHLQRVPPGCLASCRFGAIRMP